MYRAVALYGMQNGIIVDGKIDTEKLRNAMSDIKITFSTDENTKKPVTMLNGTNVEDEIRTLEVSQYVSPVAALDFVRTALIEQQREMGKSKGIVMDGRDIGTTVFPDAELKIFVTAGADVRARRRYDELVARGSNPNYDEILANVVERDRLDQTREVSPLRKADDALLLDNSNMTIEGQLQWLCDEYKKCIEQ
jgi:cytidylate kinase